MSEGRTTPTAIRLLILGSSRDQTETIEASLRNGGLAVHCVQVFDSDALKDQINMQVFDLVLCCAYDPNVDTMLTMEIVKEQARDLPVLLLFTATTDHTKLLQAMRKGARDIIPFNKDKTDANANASANVKKDLEYLQLIIAREINDLKQRRELNTLKQRLLVSEQRCLDLVEESREAIAFFQDGMHVHVNPAYLQLFGFQNQEDVEALPLLDIVDKEHHKALRAALKTFESTNEHQPVTLDIICKRQDDSTLNVGIVIDKVEIEGEPSLQLTVRSYVPCFRENTASLASKLDIKADTAHSPIVAATATAATPAHTSVINTNTSTLSSSSSVTAKSQVNNPPVTAISSAERSAEESRIIQILDRALSHNRFSMVYQSIVNLHGGGIRENYLVTIRLSDEHNQAIPPEVFLKLAKKYEKLGKIDRWVIRHAIASLSAQRQKGMRTNFFIMLSDVSILDKNLLLWVLDCLREFDARGGWLTFQINEKYARDNIQAVAKLIEGLKTIKCQIALDEFGLLPNPENVLNQLDVDYVKLSASFMKNIHIDENKQDELSQLNEMLKRHGVKTIATEIEDHNSLSILWNLGVTYVQGNFLQKPSTIIEIDNKPKEVTA